jgi:hypothetical protein
MRSQEARAVVNPPQPAGGKGNEIFVERILL